jgi:alkaline phosphatase D
MALQLVAEWRGQPQRRWAGPTIWTNRLQDWMVRDGALVCEPADRVAPCRTAHVLTHHLVEQPGGFRVRAVIRMPRDLSEPSAPATQAAPVRAGREDVTAPPAGVPGDAARVAFVGLLVGAGEGRLDYRAAAMVHHSPGKGGGLLAVYEPGSRTLTFRDMSQPETRVDFPALAGQATVAAVRGVSAGGKVVLDLEAVPEGEGRYTLRLSLLDGDSGEALGVQELGDVPAGKLLGNVALAANPGVSRAVFGFERVEVAGPRLRHEPRHTFGPIAGTLYSVAGKTLKLSAQFMHLGEALLDNDPDATEAKRLRASLQVRPVGGGRKPGPWKMIGLPLAISPPDYCVLFRDDNWDASLDYIARIAFEDADGRKYSYDTFITHDPAQKAVVSAAGFTGMGAMGRTAYQAGPAPKDGEVLTGRWTPANVWVPFAESVRAVQKQNVDVLFFTGDQIYEGKPSPKDFGRMPVEDYLYKWLLWHWSFRELTNHLPAIGQTDDHDVYHGNVWGWSGRLNLTGNNRDGGYLCSPSFVNIVQRTQAGHNPDAYDAGPADTGITHYYSTFAWGGVGFAVLEDRKFKTPPDVTDPARQEQLGPRQLQMLKEWGEDWAGQIFKVVVSQTIYASMHVDDSGQLVADADSNGFPKVGRDQSVRMFQRCGAFLLCGDQHLGTFARLGLEKPSDGVYQFCVPAMGNIFWRWFYPATPGGGRAEGEADHLGEFTDRYGNLFRMIAVANPERKQLLGQKLRQRYLIPQEEAKAGLGDEVRASQGDGYGIVRFDKKARTITAECWPYNADPVAGDKPFPGWPVTVQYDELDGRKPVAWLPDLKIEGAPEAVVQIIDQKTGEAIRITRAKDGFHRPGVFRQGGTYTLRVGVPEDERPWWVARDLVPGAEPGERTLEVSLK